MTVDERLSKLRKIEHQIRIKIERLESLEALVNRATASYSDMPRGSYNPARREEKMVEYIDLKREIRANIEALSREERYIRKTIEEVPEPYKSMLEEHYINGASWSDIAAANGQTPRHIYRLRDKALEAVESSFRQNSV